MDTEDLTEMAHETLNLAYKCSDYLQCDFGVLASKFQNENDYLKELLEFSHEIKDDPQGYLEEWGIQDQTNLSSFEK